MLNDVESIWESRLEDVENFRVIRALFYCLDIRDPLTAIHSLNMAHHSYRLAGYFDKENAFLYYAGSLIHDIGKVGMNDKVLKGEGKLTIEERTSLRQHVIDGSQIIKGFDLPRIVTEIVRYHHERYDGSGYLEGLNGSAIPLAGRITAITDTYSALTSDRPYAKALSRGEAINVLRKDRFQFDPTLLNCFIEIVD